MVFYSPVRTSRASHYELESLNSLFRERFPKVSNCKCCVMLMLPLLLCVQAKEQMEEKLQVCVCVCVHACTYNKYSNSSSVTLVFKYQESIQMYTFLH